MEDHSGKPGGRTPDGRPLGQPGGRTPDGRPLGKLLLGATLGLDGSPRPRRRIRPKAHGRPMGQGSDDPKSLLGDRTKEDRWWPGVPQILGNWAKRWMFARIRCAPSSAPKTANSFRPQSMTSCCQLCVRGEFADVRTTPHRRVPRSTAAWAAAA